MDEAVLKKRVIGTGLVLILLFFAVAMPEVKAFAAESVKDAPAAEKTGAEVLPQSEESAARIEELLQSEEDIQYYAYLNLEAAEESLKPVILAARNKIIFRYSWVADGVSGRIYGKDGNIKEELPQFSELFPADWNEPVFPVQKVDLSYYAPPVER